MSGRGLVMVVALLLAGSGMGAGRTAPETASTWNGRRRLLDESPPAADTTADPPTVSTGRAVLTINLNQTSGLPSFKPNKMAGYRSEERDYWDKIYSPEHTLKPLNVESNRVQISLTDFELGPDGTFLDPAGTQKGILHKIAESVGTDIFITVGYPWTNTSQQMITQGFPLGWFDYWKKTYYSLADALVSPAYWTGKPIWVELLGEPDLEHWSFVYGSDPQGVYAVVKMMYEAFSRYPGKFKIGGCGWADATSTWASNFLDYAKANNLEFDFYSYHYYLGWTDRSNPANPPARLHNDLSKVQTKFRQLLEEKGMGDVPIIVSEYAWMDGDLVASAGFNETVIERSGRQTMAGHQNCARTLQSMDFVIGDPSIARAYWAQGVGREHTPEWREDWVHLFAYDPFVVYVEGKDEWRYKSSYYAFWALGQLQGTRLPVQSNDPALGVWAAKDDAAGAVRVVIWNRSNKEHSASLALPGASESWICTMYRIDDTTFKLSAGGLDAIVSGPTSQLPPLELSVKTVGDALRFLQAPLRPEATIMLFIYMFN